MIPGTIKIVLGDRSLILSKFNRGDEYPRTRIDPPKLNYSLNLNPLIEGSGFEPKYLWNMTVKLKPADVLILDKIYTLSIATNAAITLHDYTKPFTEQSPRTRAYADDVSTLLDSDTDSATYYAKFSVFFVAEPAVKPQGDRDEVVLTFQELDKVAA